MVVLFNLAIFISDNMLISLKVGVPKNFENDTVKHLCWSLFFNRIAGLRYEILLK